MSNHKTIENELKSLGSSLPVVNSPSFSVSEGYFEGLAESVLAKLKEIEESTTQAELSELSPLLAGLTKATPYSVPSSYFEENLQGLPFRQSELDSPVLAATGKDVPYQVPPDYFNGFPAQVLAKVSAPKAKVVPLFARTWMRVASAAVVGGALMVGGLQLFGGKQNGNETANQPADTASAYVAQAKPAIVQEIKKASTKDLVAA